MLKMERPDALGEALTQRKGKGLDVTILLGIPDELRGLESGDSVGGEVSDEVTAEDSDPSQTNEALGLAPEAEGEEALEGEETEIVPQDENSKGMMGSILGKIGLPKSKMIGRPKPKV